MTVKPWWVAPSGVGGVPMVQYGYDPAGQVSTVTRGGTAFPLATAVTYDGAGQVSSLVHASEATVLDGYDITRNVLGSPTEVTATTGGATSSVLYSYDVVGRLRTECYPASGEVCTSRSPRMVYSAFRAVVDWDGVYASWDASIGDYREGAKEKGGWTQLNLTFNPVLQALMAGDATIASLKQGDYKGAGAHLFDAEAATAGAIGLACGAAKSALNAATKPTIAEPVPPVAKPPTTPALPAGAKIQIGNSKYGLQHILERHSYNSLVTKPASKFLKSFGASEIRRAISDAVAGGGACRVEGTSRVLDTSLGRIVGTDQAGNPTSGIRVVTDADGVVITAYPIEWP